MDFLILLALLGLASQIVALPVENVVSGLDTRSSNLLPGGLKLNFKVSRGDPRNNSSRFGKRSGIYETLVNQGTYYSIELEFGSQKTPISLLLDTGSSDTWVPSPLAKCTTCKQYGVFDPSDSSTSQNQNQSFWIQYGSNITGATGEFYLDEVAISGVTVKDAIFAVASEALQPRGILGIGSSYIESMIFETGYKYENFPQKLVSNGLISKNFYSIYLNGPNATEGSIIFGGIDSTKYTGPLVTLTSSFLEQVVNLVSITTANVTHAVNYRVVLDTGTAYTYLDKPEVDAIASNFPGAYLNLLGYYAVDCNNVPNDNVTYSFGGVDINIPLSSLVGRQYDAQGWVPGCILDVGISSTYIPPILGDNFLRYAYVVYDVQDWVILLAQALPA